MELIRMNKSEFKAAMSVFRKELDSAHKAGREAFGIALNKKVCGFWLCKFLKLSDSKPVSIKVMLALESRGILPVNFDADRAIRYN
jgi:hypothetical protein